ncbi:hypothetical protein [Prosthecodimorpha staleyi]|uniref:Uncharacterized protein n=1 Tax=Prosthecodimorpha staleyi TaxID=2840188 RepID=A0A947DBI8_9HYPH|nr:hypothetical protein [Prosthecodimorpha staleyi]MBT9292702.1 hypothetical protein [Prosthecodimorpha staleyi]
MSARPAPTVSGAGRPVVATVSIDGRPWRGRGNLVDGASPVVVLTLEPLPAAPLFSRQAEDAEVIHDIRR